MELIFWSSVALFVIALIVVAILVIKERKLYANRNKTPQLLDDNSLSEGEIFVQCSQQPTFDVY